MRGKISVIVPVYQVEQYLDECVQSIVNQTYSDLEIILVDDGSKDRCPFMCDAWAEKDQRIKVIHKENGGLSDARNAGIEQATGDYIAFVDSDDWIREDMYEKMLSALISENADFCACNIVSCFENREAVWGCPEYTVGDSEKILSMLYGDTKFPVAAWNKLYKRKCWETIRFPKGKICEDCFTTYLLVHEAERIVQITEPLYCYRIRPQSIMTASFSRKRMDEEEAWRMNYEFMKEHYPSVYPKAFTFYLLKINAMLRKMSKEDKIKFKDEYSYLNEIRKKNIFHILFHSNLILKQRLKYLSESIRG